jgi:hypothetical protein
MVTIPNPPRLSGNPKIDVQVLEEYSHQLYNALIIGAQIVDRLDRVAALTPLNLTISASPSQAQVQAIANKIDALIEASTIQ